MEQLLDKYGMTEWDIQATVLRNLAQSLKNAKIVAPDLSNVPMLRDLVKYANETATAVENRTIALDSDDILLVTECIQDELAKQ